ncbi:MAG: hypothetical protein IKS65_02575 [Bacteroidales bacterium]|nr:hypothetical protein [Bacteroidales bacterium]
MSCASRKPTITHRTSDTIYVEKSYRDTLIKVEPDSASIRAVIECDSAGHVLMRELETERGRRITAEFRLTNMNANAAELDFGCKEDSLLLKIALLEKCITRLRERQDSEVIYVERQFRWWEKGLMWLGVISTGLLSILILIVIFVKR